MINIKTARENAVREQMKKAQTVYLNACKQISSSIAANSKAGLFNTTYTIDKTHSARHILKDKLEGMLIKNGYKVNEIDTFTLGISW